MNNNNMIQGSLVGPNGETIFGEIQAFFNERPDSDSLSLDAPQPVNEAFRNRSRNEINRTKEMEDNLVRSIFGKKYGKQVTPMNDRYIKYRTFKNLPTPMDYSMGNSQLFKFGNDKVASNTLIIDFTSALNCPSLNSCPVSQAVCYGVSAENQYPQTAARAYRINNLTMAIWSNKKKNTPEAPHAGDAIIRRQLKQFFDLAKEYIIAQQEKIKKQKEWKNNYEQNPAYPKFVRINAVGDFLSQEWVDASDEFAGEVESLGVQVMTYTARVHKNITFKNVKHMVINASSKMVSSNLPEKTIRREFLKSAEVNKAIVYGYGKIEDMSALDGELSEEMQAEVLNADITKADTNLVKEYIAEHGIGGTEVNENDHSQPYLVNGNYVCPCTVNPNAKPCGLDCQVCYGKAPGINENGKTTTQYNILIAVHGGNRGNFNPEYHDAKANGDEDSAMNAIFNPKNKNGNYTQQKIITGKFPDQTTIRLEQSLWAIQNGVDTNPAHLSQEYIDTLKQAIELGHDLMPIRAELHKVDLAQRRNAIKPENAEKKISDCNTTYDDIDGQIRQLLKKLLQIEREFVQQQRQAQPAYQLSENEMRFVLSEVIKLVSKNK